MGEVVLRMVWVPARHCRGLPFFTQPDDPPPDWTITVRGQTGAMWSGWLVFSRLFRPNRNRQRGAVLAFVRE